MGEAVVCGHKRSLCNCIICCYQVSESQNEMTNATQVKARDKCNENIVRKLDLPIHWEEFDLTGEQDPQMTHSCTPVIWMEAPEN
ncbi:hypothetical protein CapIbe_011845 [Capra ibex]